MTRGRVDAAAWVAALAVAWTALAFSGYRSRDPDSRLHAQIEADQLSRPASLWIAPKWTADWQMEGLYREHPVGTFVPAVLLARLGYPVEQAGYAVNAVYQVAALLAITRLAACFVAESDARSLLWLLQLIPIAFTYRVRANHEPAVLFFMVLALYGTERSRRQAAFAGFTVAGVLGMMLVKGIFAVLVPASCALWLVASRWRSRPLPGGPHATDPGSDRAAWIGIALAVLAAAAGAALYEYAYRQATGETFLGEYLRRQLGVAAVQSQAGAMVIARKAYNLGFYAARLLWFGMPWTLALAVGSWRLRGRGAAGPESGPCEGAVGALRAVLAVAALWLGAFSLSDRLADRFIFPVYFLVAAAGALFALRTMPAVRAWVRRAGRLDPLTAPLLWIVLFFLQLVSPHLGLPYVNR